MNSYEVIQLAKKYANNGASMQSSAQLCLKDAIDLQQQGKRVAARNRAVKSLQYSVGVFHPDYKVCALVDEVFNEVVCGRMTPNEASDKLDAAGVPFEVQCRALCGTAIAKATGEQP